MQLNENINTVAPINIDIKRSRFDRNKEVLTTFNAGDLIPILVEEVIPGDSVTMDVASLVRMSTPIYPVMDTAYMDLHAFYVPNRLVWTHAEEFIGANSNTVYDDPVEYQIPQIKAPANGWDYGTIADQFGIPPKIGGFTTTSLPFRGYCLIWNEFYRSNSLTQPVDIDTGDATVQGENASWTDYVTKGTLGGAPLRVSRYHDLFSSALAAPQAGAEVTIPLTGFAPTYNAYGSDLPVGYDYYNANITRASFPQYALSKEQSPSGYTYKAGTGDYIQKIFYNSLEKADYGTINDSTHASSEVNGPISVNLVADLEHASAGIPISTLRQATAIQRILEQVNRGGSRYEEIILSCFGVSNGDARIQHAEFLGGKRVPINMNEINQTSSTDNTSPLGQPGASSKTLSNDTLFTKSFSEPGILFVFASVRPVHTYSNGLGRFWRKKDRFDFYYPALANISDQAINNSEIFLQSDSVVDSDGNVVNDMPFGYQEAFYDYRQTYNEVRNLMRPSHPQTLASWNYADNYSELPTLSSGWLIEDGSQIARTLAVQNQPQFIADFYFKATWTRPMPIRSIPGMSANF